MSSAITHKEFGRILTFFGEDENLRERSLQSQFAYVQAGNSSAAVGRLGLWRLRPVFGDFWVSRPRLPVSGGGHRFTTADKFIIRR